MTKGATSCNWELHLTIKNIVTVWHWTGSCGNQTQVVIMLRWLSLYYLLKEANLVGFKVLLGRVGTLVKVHHVISCGLEKIPICLQNI